MGSMQRAECIKSSEVFVGGKRASCTTAPRQRMPGHRVVASKSSGYRRGERGGRHRGTAAKGVPRSSGGPNEPSTAAQALPRGAGKTRVGTRRDDVRARGTPHGIRCLGPEAGRELIINTPGGIFEAFLHEAATALSQSPDSPGFGPATDFRAIASRPRHKSRAVPYRLPNQCRRRA